MAASKLATGAQFPAQCQLCEANINIKFKCLDCDLLMCQKCNDRVHPKFKKASEHRIIDIKNIRSPFRNDSLTTLSLEEEYQTNLSCVSFITVISNYCLWIGQREDKKQLHLPLFQGLQKVQLEGKTTKPLLCFNGDYFLDMCKTPSNDLLVVTSVDLTLKIIRKDSNILSNSVYCVKGPIPFSVHVTRDFKVIVGCSNINHGLVIVMDQDGTYLTKYIKDHNKEDIFPNSIPVKIVSTSDENIFVVSHGKLDRVVILKGGEISNVYTGNPKINKEENKFEPRDVKVSQSDNAVVSDYSTHTLHILNNTGYLLTCVNTKEIGIEFPESLAITSAENLNILFIAGGHFIAEKEKIYRLHFSGF